MLIPLINVVFSPCFVDHFLSLNNLKNRMDHETRQLVKNFWEDAPECHNNFHDFDFSVHAIVNNKKDDDFDMLLQKEHIAIDLEDANNMTAETLQKKVMTMMKICQLVKQNMHVSRTHSTRVLDYLNAAIDKTKGGSNAELAWSVLLLYLRRRM